MFGRSRYDAVVAGLGIMGAATIYHLARAGLSVLGIEAGGPSHIRGSSHGDTRIFRRAYWEGEHYVPLLNRSYDGWMELNEFANQEVCYRTGGLFLGAPGSALVKKSLQTARRCRIEHEPLDADAIRARFPAFAIDDGVEAVFEPSALMLFAENARLAFLRSATEAGATLVYGVRVASITSSGHDSVAVAGDGWQLHCARAIATAGPWLGRLLQAELGAILRPQRIPIYWFDPVAESAKDFAVDRFPLFLLETPDGELIYGLPKWRDVCGGVKIGFHNRQLSDVDLDAPPRAVRPVEREALWHQIRSTFPGLRPDGRGISCIYTMSPDESFILDRSKLVDGLIFASACSGHGFKFAPAIGEALAEIAIHGASTTDIGAFSLARFRSAAERSPVAEQANAS